MNALERRRIAKSNVIDVSIAKVAINRSRRQRQDAAKKLRKAMAASHFASVVKAETVSYPRHAVG